MLLVVLAGTAFNFYRSRFSSDEAAPPPVSLDARFTPLNVDNPALRLDILKRFLALEYKGVHRSIFSATLPPPPAPPPSKQPVIVAPGPPPGPPPLTVDAKYFGYVSDFGGNHRRAFFCDVQQRGRHHRGRRGHLDGPIPRRSPNEHDRRCGRSFFGTPRHADSGRTSSERVERDEFHNTRNAPAQRGRIHAADGGFHGGGHDHRCRRCRSKSAHRGPPRKGRRKWCGAGEQYERAIGLYYRKFGKYPTKVEDLTKQTNGVRFLRQAYTDPMNKDDGSWRFIYVGPNGQLIGSLRQTNLLQTTLSTPGLGGALSLGGGLQPLAPPGTGPGTGPGTTPGMNAGARRGPTGTANEPGHRRESVGIPAATVGWNRHGREHHRSRQQNQKAFRADLFGRRHLPGVGIHLESYRANRSAGADACKSERESHYRSKRRQSERHESERDKSQRNQSERGQPEFPGRTAAAAESASASRQHASAYSVDIFSSRLQAGTLGSRKARPPRRKRY